jgi:hypothetical protein
MLKKRLHDLICKIWNNEKILIEGSEGIICPIFKKGDPKTVRIIEESLYSIYHIKYLPYYYIIN